MSQFAQPTILTGNVVIRGNLSSETTSQPANSVSDPTIATPAAGASGVNTDKLNHRTKLRHIQPDGIAVVTQTNFIGVTQGTIGAIISVFAMLKVACIGAATITVDIKKNGTTILSAVITFNSSSAIDTPVTATITVPATTAGDYFESIVTATAGGGTVGQGLYVEATLDESPS